MENSQKQYIDQLLLCRNFDVPDVASDLVDYFFSKEDQTFLLQIGKEPFSGSDFDSLYIRNAYQRGLISKLDEQGLKYKQGHFYEMLDIFVCTRKEKYDELPAEKKAALDNWYFDTYCQSLCSDLQHRPTSDKVLPLHEILQLVEADDRTPYLNYCDCRSLNGACHLPLRTCITYRSGINSFSDRGITERIDKSRVLQILKDADKAGLMHTINEHGICNCCDDCCYLFRARKQKNFSIGFWPEAKYVIEFNEKNCIACGLCTKRCHMGVFDFIKEHLTCHTSSCTGCGLCVSTCPSGALNLTEKNKSSEENKNELSGLSKS